MTIFTVPDMSCGHCKAAIEKAITGADSTAAVSFDMDARKIEVSSSLTVDELAALLSREGYPSSVSA